MSKELKIGNMLTVIVALSCAGCLTSCASMPKTDVTPIGNFNVERYLGDWYEIGRFDFKWEKNMKNVTANYSLNKNGTIKVTNSGYDYVSKKYKESVGKAKFATAQKTIADMKVSFFGPFYSAYKVIAIDPDYRYALVAGANSKLLWILSRTPTIPDDVKQNYIQIAKTAGYDLTDFVWTVQDEWK